MRTNRTARQAARHANLNRPTLASMFVAAATVAAVTILVTVAVVALACYLAGAPSGAPSEGGHRQQASTAPLIDPTAGRGADSATCKHAPRSPRCLREGGTAAVVRDRGAARPAGGSDDQTVLLGREGARPAEVPGRVPGRGGWVSEEGPSQA